MKWKDLLTKLTYLSSLTFCRPLPELLPLITNTIYNSQTLFLTLLPPDLHAHIVFCWEHHFLTQPSYLANYHSYLKTQQAFVTPTDWIVFYQSAFKAPYTYSYWSIVSPYTVYLLDGQHIQHLVQCLTLGKDGESSLTYRAHWCLDPGLSNPYSS